MSRKARSQTLPTLLLTLFFSAAHAQGDQTVRGDWYVETPAKNDDFRIVLWHAGPNRTPAFDNEITYTIYCVTNQATRIYIPKNKEYLCDVELFDTNGRALAKSKAAVAYGRRFDQVVPLSRAGKSTAEEMDFAIAIAHKGQGSSSAYGFAKLEDIFDVKQPGHYRVRLRFQIFRLEKQDSQNYFKLVRFDPVEYDIVVDSKQ